MIKVGQIKLTNTDPPPAMTCDPLVLLLLTGKPNSCLCDNYKLVG